MIIISDTTPLHYLVLIEKETILPELFDEIVIPEAVAAEMKHVRTPPAVRRFIDAPPEWVRIEAVTSTSLLQNISGLGAGETQAIAMALEKNADAVLMDDRKAIRRAREMNLTVLTTLALLELASIKELIDLPQILDDLAQTNFRMPPDEIIEEMLERYQKRTQSDE